jgi:hypothetical protein
MMLPSSAAFCANWRTWPALIVYVVGLPWGPAATPVPPVMAAVGLIVTMVPSCWATTSMNGRSARTSPAPKASTAT